MKSNESIRLAEASDWKTLQDLVEHQPETARDTDDYGMLPLHWASTERGVPAEALLALLKAYPEGARTKNNANLLPLHIAIRAKVEISWIEHLLEAFPASIVSETPHGLSPVGLAEQTQLSRKHQEVLMKFQDQYVERHGVPQCSKERRLVEEEEEIQSDDHPEQDLPSSEDDDERLDRVSSSISSDDTNSMDRFSDDAYGNNQHHILDDPPFLSFHSSSSSSLRRQISAPAMAKPVPKPNKSTTNFLFRGQKKLDELCKSTLPKLKMEKQLSLPMFSNSKHASYPGEDASIIDETESNIGLEDDLGFDFDHDDEEEEEEDHDARHLSGFFHVEDDEDETLDADHEDFFKHFHPPPPLTLLEERRKPRWQKLPACYMCHVHFSMFRHRHHCRNCGQSICSEHTGGRVMLPEKGYRLTQRTCVVCYAKLKPSRSRHDHHRNRVFHSFLSSSSGQDRAHASSSVHVHHDHHLVSSRSPGMTESSPTRLRKHSAPELPNVDAHEYIADPKRTLTSGRTRNRRTTHPVPKQKSSIASASELRSPIEDDDASVMSPREHRLELKALEDQVNELQQHKMALQQQLLEHEEMQAKTMLLLTETMTRVSRLELHRDDDKEI